MKMLSLGCATAVTAFWLPIAPVNYALASPSAEYVVVVSQKAHADPEWRQVAEALCSKHGGTVLLFRTNVDEVLPMLRELFPRYVCFVAPPNEASRAFVANVHRLTRKLDDDPYTDCFWGILTGFDAPNAMRIAKHGEPLTVRKVAGGTELAMDMVEEGVWYCELTKNRMVRKERGGEAKLLHGPDDTTEALVQTLNEYCADLFVTSGHATEREWTIGYRYQNGFFKHENGRLYGEDMQKRKLPIVSPNPKVYLPVGNCLMGHIDQPDCMATAWMNSAGVHQMIGYTVPTWYGYAGWGCLDYFLEQPGRYTFNEAFFANHAALIHRLETFFPGTSSVEMDAQGMPRTSLRVGEKARAAGLTANDARGLLFDRDVVAFYGDPAWEARMADRPKAFDQTLEVRGDMFTFEVRPRRGADSFRPINTNGSQRGGRPFIAFLPYRVEEVQLVEGADLQPTITDNFIIMPNPGVCDPTRTYRVVFKGKPVRRKSG